MKRLLSLAILLIFTVASFAEDFEVDGIFYRITSSTNNTVSVTYKGSSSSSYDNEYTGNVTIPSSIRGNQPIPFGNKVYRVTGIDDETFRGCKNLTSISIPDSVKLIGNEAFYGCNGLTNIIVDAGNPKYDSRNNCNAIIETSTNELIYGCKNTVIPNTVTKIGDSAFLGCTELKNIIIPNCVTEIGSAAFQYCNNLKRIIIPNSVTKIGNDAFKGCSLLTTITIGDSVTEIGFNAFYNCTRLIKVVVSDIAAWCNISFGDNPLSYAHHLYSDENTEITNLIIPNSVTSIGEKTFKDCTGFTSVAIPNCVAEIGDSAFFSCI